jgi:hypothetical protein
LCVKKSQFVPVIFEPPCKTNVEEISHPRCNLYCAKYTDNRLRYVENVIEFERVNTWLGCLNTGAVHVEGDTTRV